MVSVRPTVESGRVAIHSGTENNSGTVGEESSHGWVRLDVFRAEDTEKVQSIEWTNQIPPRRTTNGPQQRCSLLCLLGQVSAEGYA